MLWTAPLISLLALVRAENLFGPKFKPTTGEIWPRPFYQVKEPNYFTYNHNSFEFKVTGHSCDILTKAIDRYGFVLRDARRTAARLYPGSPENIQIPADEYHKGYIEQLQVKLTSPCEDYPHFDMVESYNLTVNSVSTLQSESIWGVLRGLESFAQLFYSIEDGLLLRINKTTIMDTPVYSHRGLLLDTSRHYISVGKILTTLEAMAVNKMNVFHWHIVDDQSFPYQSEKFPELSQRGAYHRSMVYSKEDIRKIIAYALDRGIRVLPEFDVPGHTRSWGESHPEILTECYSAGTVSELGPMHPLRNDTYRLLQQLFQEIQEWFPDKYLHVGGDEVNLRCWESNPELQKFMEDNNLSAAQLHGLFMSRVIPLLGSKSQPIVWQEVFDEGVQLPNNTLVHVWKTNEIGSIIRSGYKVIYSTAWYLDHLSTGGDWEKMYELQLHHLSETGVVGGEAAMWGEVVDDNNVISRVWPRASAVAEKLWSPPYPGWYSYPTRETYSRLEEHTCRMNRRGIRAQPPSGPGYCLGAINA